MKYKKPVVYNLMITLQQRWWGLGTDPDASNQNSWWCWQYHWFNFSVSRLTLPLWWVSFQKTIIFQTLYQVAGNWLNAITVSLFNTTAWVLNCYTCTLIYNPSIEWLFVYKMVSSLHFSMKVFGEIYFWGWLWHSDRTYYDRLRPDIWYKRGWFQCSFSKTSTSCKLEFIMMNEVIDWIAIYSVMLWMPCLEK